MKRFTKNLKTLPKLLASSILNVESGIEIVATLPFSTSSVSATLEHEIGVPANFVTGPNLCPIGASERFVISSDSSHHSSTNASEAEGDSIIRSAVVPSVMTEAVITIHVASILSAPALEPSTKVITPVHAFMFHDSDSAAGTSHVPKKELSMGSREVDFESLYDVFVSRWKIPHDALLDNLDTSREFIDHLAPLVLFAPIRDMDYEELFTEFSVGTARQACLSAEVRMQTEYCLSEWRRLESEFEKQTSLLKAKDDEVEGLKALLLLKETKAAEAIRLHAEVSKFKVMEKSLQDETNVLKKRIALLEKERDSLNAKVTNLEALAVEKERELTDLNSLITSVKSQNDILVDRLYAQGMELVIVKCLNSPEYLSALGAAISKAIEKGMQDGLSAGITHCKEAEPFSTAALTCTKGTSGIVFAAANTTTALSTTLTSSSIVPPNTIEDYEVMVPSPLPYLAWERSLHFMRIAFLEIADVPCSRKGVPVVVFKLVRSFAQCIHDFIWSFSLRSELASILRMACFIASVDEVGMPISSGITAYVPYVSENGVSPLLDLIIVWTFRERSGYVDSSFVKWPRGRDGGQILLQVSWHSAVNLAVVAFPY
nr:hypothetical protein [Tanacetum cinerariifolium]